MNEKTWVQAPLLSLSSVWPWKRSNFWTKVTTLNNNFFITKGILSEFPSSSDTLLSCDLFYSLSTSSMSHGSRILGACSLEGLHILRGTFHSSNIIFLMWSLAVSWIPPAHAGWVDWWEQMTYLLSQFLAVLALCIPIRAPEEGEICQVQEGVCCDSHAAFEQKKVWLSICEMLACGWDQTENMCLGKWWV